jgi:dodecin
MANLLVSDHVYEIAEIVGTSKISMEDAVQSAIAKAATSVRELRWFEVVQSRGLIEDGKVACHQVILKVGFVMNS